MTYTIAVCTVKKTPDDGQRNCSKHVEFYSKNIFEKLVHLVGFIIKMVTSPSPSWWITVGAPINTEHPVYMSLVEQSAHFAVCNESLCSTFPFKVLATVVVTWCNLRWQTDKALTDTWQGPSDVSTGYGLDGLGSNSGRGGILRISSDWLWGAPCLL